MNDSSAKPDSRDDALAVVRRLRDNGHVAYFAGGCVRDALLGLEPKDYDVATDAPPERVRQLFRRTQAVGAAFGVILVREMSSQIEVATFRKDLRYVDGRRPEGVVFSNAEEDAKRRDFTINGLFFDPIESKVIDFVGGQEDLQTKTLRAIGNPEERFSEDYLRLLRAVRFAARFGLTIEPSTSEAIARNVPNLTRISPERIAEELRLALTALATRPRAWELVRGYCIDSVLFRFVAMPPVHPGIQAARKEVFSRVSPGQVIHFGLALAAAATEYATGRLSSLSDWDEVSVRKIVNGLRQSLRISNEEVDVLEGGLYGLGHLVRNPTLTLAQLKRFLARPTAKYSRALMEALPQEWVPHKSDTLRRLAQVAKSEYAPAPLVTGDDLTAGGFRPGPAFKRALDAAYDAQLEGSVVTKEQALELATRVARDSQSC
jgi:poly(A) polymerase